MNPRQLTPRAQKGILKGNKFAEECGHQYVGTEHILVGLLRLKDGLAFKILISCGVTEEMVHAALVEAGQCKPKSDLDKLSQRVEDLEKVVRNIIAPQIEIPSPSGISQQFEEGNAS